MSLLTVLGLLGALWLVDGTDSLSPGRDGCEIENVALRPGWFELAPATVERRLESSSAVWRTAEDRRGRVWLAAGGGLWRLNRSGAERVFTRENNEVMALCVGPDGSVWFGLTPAGEVWRIGPGGNPELVLTTGEGFVHDLTVGPDGAVYAATGPTGRLFRIGRGKPGVVFAAPQMHLLSLESVPGGLLVGTAPDGLVYRLKPRGEGQFTAEVLFDAPLAEVRALGFGKSGQPGAGTEQVYVAANSAPEIFEPPQVFCLNPDRTVRWSWTAPDSVVHALLCGPDGVLVGTGGPGRLVELDRNGQAAVLRRFDEGAVVSLARGSEGRLLGLANPARLVVLKNVLADSGWISAPVFDCGAPARSGRLDRLADVPTGTGLEFELRTGFSRQPDSTWTEWRPAAGFAATGRFLQWRARLSSEILGRSPRVERVELYYSVPNRAPVVGRLEVSGVSLADARLGRSRPVREFTFSADDPDSDSLEAFLELRPRGKVDPIVRLGPVAERRFELDSRTLADGWYVAEVLVTDRPARGSSALEDRQSSRPFLIDNTPPTVTELSAAAVGSGRVRVRVRAADALSPIVACRIAVDGGEWQALDVGAGDELSVELTAEVKTTAEGRVAAVTVSDAGGNVVAAQQVIKR